MKYCRYFDYNRYYSMDAFYIYIPNNLLHTGIFYFLLCLVIQIIIQKILNKIKNIN